MAAFEQAWQRILDALRVIGQHIGNELVRLFERLLALAERLVGIKLSAEMDETASGVDRIETSFIRLLDRAAEFADVVAAAIQTAANRWDLFVDLVQHTISFLAEWFKSKFSSVALDLKMKMETMFSGAIEGAKTLLGVLQGILAVASKVESAIKNAFSLSDRLKNEARIEAEVRKLVDAGHTETLDELRRFVIARMAAERAAFAPVDAKALKLFPKLFKPLPDMLEQAGQDLKESASIFAGAISDTILGNNQRLPLEAPPPGGAGKKAGTEKFSGVGDQGFSGFLGFEELARKTQELAFGNKQERNSETLVGLGVAHLSEIKQSNNILSSLAANLPGAFRSAGTLTIGTGTELPAAALGGGIAIG